MNLINQVKTRIVFGAEIRVKYLKKRARKYIFKSLSCSKDTRQEAIEEVKKQYDILLKDSKDVLLGNCYSYECLENDYGLDSRGEPWIMVSKPLLPEVSNCNCEAFKVA